MSDNPIVDRINSNLDELSKTATHLVEVARTPEEIADAKATITKLIAELEQFEQSL